MILSFINCGIANPKVAQVISGLAKCGILEIICFELQMRRTLPPLLFTQFFSLPLSLVTQHV